MAGFKEYQMLFQLNASVGGSFNSAFSTGASSISQLQDKINALNKTNSDISSYQKQQSANCIRPSSRICRMLLRPPPRKKRNWRMPLPRRKSS